MKTGFATLSALVFAFTVFGQSVIKRKLITGVYANEREFLAREPSITKPFKIVPNIDISFNETNAKMDTTETGITYQYLDSTQKHKNAFGFCDGTDIYLGAKRFGYDKMDFVGKYSFINTNYNYANGSFVPLILAAGPISLMSAAVLIGEVVKKPTKKYLFFINKSGKLHEATGQAIGWFLKDDKDLLDGFNAEKKYNNEVFKKYLMKMNERYPES